MATVKNTSLNYINGNLAGTLNARRAFEEAPTGAPLKEYIGEHKKSQKMNMSFVYVLFLTAAMVITGIALITYLKLQSDITNSVSNIARLEQTLNNLTLANDDEYSKMNNTVDYDEIRRIAIEELGMVYASENQIISYKRENSDYVRQLNSLSNQ